MNVQQIYSTYRVPSNLQQHMLRVAAVAYSILQGWTGEPVNKEAIIQTCLFHDIAKPVTFDMQKQRRYVSTEEELQEVASLKQWLLETYGSNEHAAAEKIFLEIGVIPKAIQLLQNLEWSYIPKLLLQDDIESLLPIYADMRIGPQGILSLEDRLTDLASRATVEDFDQQEQSGKHLESLVRKQTTTNLDTMSDEDIAAVIEKELSQFEIK